MSTGLKVLLGIIVGFVLLIGGCVIITGGIFTLGIKKAGEIENSERQQVADAVKNNTAIALEVKKFLAEYESNKLAADEKYINKVLALTGTISDISDSLGQLSISLSGDSKSLNTVSCFFDDADRGELTKLSKGQKITVAGICLSDSLLTKCNLIQ